MRWPNGDIREGRKIDGLIELVDLAPTLLEAAGLEIPNRMQGKSLLSLLKGGGEGDFCREQVYSEYYKFLDPWRRVRYNVTNARRKNRGFSRDPAGRILRSEK